MRQRNRIIVALETLERDRDQLVKLKSAACEELWFQDTFFGFHCYAVFIRACSQLDSILS